MKPFVRTGSRCVMGVTSTSTGTASFSKGGAAAIAAGEVAARGPRIVCRRVRERVGVQATAMGSKTRWVEWWKLERR